MERVLLHDAITTATQQQGGPAMRALFRRWYTRFFGRRKKWTAEERGRAHMFILAAQLGPSMRPGPDGMIHIKNAPECSEDGAGNGNAGTPES